eukprot:3983309-Prymnesium_polylepis.1
MASAPPPMPEVIAQAIAATRAARRSEDYADRLTSYEMAILGLKQQQMDPARAASDPHVTNTANEAALHNTRTTNEVAERSVAELLAQLAQEQAARAASEEQQRRQLLALQTQWAARERQVEATQRELQARLEAAEAARTPAIAASRADQPPEPENRRRLESLPLAQPLERTELQEEVEALRERLADIDRERDTQRKREDEQRRQQSEQTTAATQLQGAARGMLARCVVRSLSEGMGELLLVQLPVRQHVVVFGAVGMDLIAEHSGAARDADAAGRLEFSPGGKAYNQACTAMCLGGQ